ncbi:MAG: TolC family protein [Cyclobacteriaceae bacterium]|nr:TolC family protein [Cyclobacteriaceae bacterium]
MRIRLTLLLSFVITTTLLAQAQITLDSCINAAYINLEFNSQAGYINEGRTYAMEGNNHYNLPVFELNASASIQNEQISIPIAIPGFEAPVAPLNFNRVLVNFNQTIYNGNLAAKKKVIDSLQYDEQLQALEIDKIKIKSQVIGVYATLMVVKTNQEILEGHIKVLGKKHKQLQGAIDGGVSTRSKLQVLEAERLKLKQRKTELSFNETALLSTLNNYTGLTLTTETKLVNPNPKLKESAPINRPELLLIDAKLEGLNAKYNLAGNARLPYVGLFGSIGVGNPGYDIFNPEVRPMAMAGIAVKWNIWDWNKSNNDKAQLVIGQSILRQQRTRAELAFERELITQQSEINKYKQLITTDDEIIVAQQNVSKSMSSELMNGTATASDYTAQLNTESAAKLNKELHQIQLILAILTYNTLKGN